MKILSQFMMLSLLLPALTDASENNLPTPFQGASQDSTLAVSYDDLSAFLKAEVLVVGRSTRKKAARAETTGTRMRSRVNRLTALEGNRFYFKALENDDVRSTLQAIKQSLELLPGQVPLSALNRKEQLAYWLNLYNFTLLEELAKQQAPGNVKNLLDYDDEDSILNKKVLNIAGEPLSLHDIQFTILKEKYNDPLVIYGLFQGNIGGPSILDEAFTGDRVWRQLEENAREFINSNRGTYFDGAVSVYYKRNMPFFDNNKEKLRSHLLDFLEGAFYSEIQEADELKFATADWQLANLTGGAREYGGSGMINNAALLDAVRSEQMLFNQGSGSGMTAIESPLGQSLVSQSRLNVRFPAAQLEMIQQLKARHQLNAGSVEIKDIDEAEAKLKTKEN